jgi:hypothetical protein
MKYDLLKLSDVPSVVFTCNIVTLLFKKTAEGAQYRDADSYTENRK